MFYKMLFVMGFSLVAVIIVFFLTTLTLLFFTRQKTKKNWKELEYMWQRRCVAANKLIEFATEIRKDRKSAAVLQRLKNDCETANVKNKDEQVLANRKLEQACDEVLRLTIVSWDEKKDSELAVYYDIKNEFMELDEKLLFTEKFYAKYADRYNGLVSQFPTNMVAGLCDFGLIKSIK